MCLRVYSFWVLWTLAAAVSPAADQKMVAETYPLGLTDFELAESIARDLVSPDGKLVADKANYRLILYDYPDRHATLVEVLRRIRAPAQHVRIQVTFKENAAVSSDSFAVDGRARVGSVVVRTPGSPSDGSARVEARQERMSLASIVQQELLVISGGKGHLQVGVDVPYAEWFWNYGTQHGFWTGSVRWREVGAKLVVEPYVMGDRIRLRLTPEFSYIINQETLTTAIQKLTTEVVVSNGQEIELGGLPVSDREFYSKFLVGYDHEGERRSLRITLRPTIETFMPPVNR